ncbi:MAG: hypothetical protein ABI200_06035 [Gaiellales bacterium]
MQIAISPQSLPTQAVSRPEVVAPATLFRAAGNRAFAALQLVAGSDGRLPSAPTASLAIQEVRAGQRLLQSAIVPGLSFSQRKVAASAISSLNEGVKLLTSYVEAVAPLGTGGTLPEARVPASSLDLLLAARDRILAAAARVVLNG